MVRASDFITANGIVIRWRRLFTVVVGAPILAYFSGATEVLLALADVPIGILRFVATFAGNFISAVYGVFPATLRAAFISAIPFVQSAGPLGFVLALVIVLGTLYAFMEGVSRVR